MQNLFCLPCAHCSCEACAPTDGENTEGKLPSRREVKFQSLSPQMHLRREWERREEREVGSSEPLEARPATGGELWQWGAEDAKERGDEGAVGRRGVGEVEMRPHLLLLVFLAAVGPGGKGLRVGAPFPFFGRRRAGAPFPSPGAARSSRSSLCALDRETPA